MEENKGLQIQKGLTSELQNFEKELLCFVKKAGLPSNGILVPLKERGIVIKNISPVLEYVDVDQRLQSVYLSKFISAASCGLFDAALNYMWDETISELRWRVTQYDVEYFYDNAVQEEKRKKLTSPEDITKLDDSELIQGARNIELISELGYRHLDYIRYMRNWASAAHPNQNQITGLQLVAWLETCVKEVISLPVSNIASEIKKLLFNIKSTVLNPQSAKEISSFFNNLTVQQVNTLASGFFGIYIQPDSSAQTNKNIGLLFPYLWGRVEEKIRIEFGIKYGKFVANGDQERATLAKKCLEMLNGLSYIPDGLKAAEIDTAIQNLLIAHRNFNNFYNEPIFVRELQRLVGPTGTAPKEVSEKYVLGVVDVFLTNGHGVAYDAEPIYKDLINKFSDEQIIIGVLSFRQENIISKLQFGFCQNKYREMLEIFDAVVSAPAIKELIKEILDFKGPLDKISEDTRVKNKIANFTKLIS